MEKYFDINENGNSIKCKLYCNQPRGIESAVIACHGFCGSKESAFHRMFAEKLLGKEKRSAVLCFDWPCHGGDVKKKLSLGLCEEYLDIVIRYARASLGAQKLFCIASSFGGYMTLVYLHRRGSPYEKIALRCPALPMHAVTKSSLLSAEDLEKLARGKDVPAGFEKKINITPAFLAELEANDVTGWDYSDYMDDVLILHGTKDEVVPPENTRAFAHENAMTYLAVEKADHQFKDPQLSALAVADIIRFFGS